MRLGWHMGCASRKIRLLLGGFGCGVVLLSALGCGTKSVSPKTARLEAEAELKRISGEARDVQARAAEEARPDAERLLSEGAQLVAVGQFDSAIDVLSQVVELGRQGAASAGQVFQAEALLGEAYFRTGQLYSAERSLRSVAESDAAEANTLRGQAAARLVDVAMAGGETARLSELLELTEKIYATDRSPAVAYARAKALFALGRFAEAATQSEAVTGERLLTRRAAYLRATALMKQAQQRGRPLDYSATVEEFSRLAKQPTAKEDATEEEIRDLARLAVARLRYETGFLVDAAESYRQVEEASPHYPTALFELGWTYVRMGDYRRAEETLQALSERSPGLIDGAEAALLRADLMLRSGRFREAEKVYEKTRDLYGPLIAQLETFIATHAEPAVYYDRLTASDIEAGGDLPKLVVDWAREIAEEQRSFALVDEVARSRNLLERTERMGSLSLSSLASGARVRAFPLTRARLKNVVRLQNGLALAQRRLAEGLDSAAGATTGELSQIRKKRRALMGKVSDLPVSDTEFAVRELKERKKWDETLTSLQQAELAANQMQALSNGLRRVLADASRGLVSLSASGQQSYSQELAQTKQELVQYRAEIERLRREIEIGRQQVGLGGEQTASDADLRGEFAELLEREIRLSSGGQDKKAAARNYSKKSLPLLEEMARVQAGLKKADVSLQSDAKAMGEVVAQKFQQEIAVLPSYQERLGEFDAAARSLVGEVARQSFVKVRDRLADVVLRADLGLVQKSWEVREEQKRRVRRLQRERAREQRLIDEEMSEVLDEPEALP